MSVVIGLLPNISVLLKPWAHLVVLAALFAICFTIVWLVRSRFQLAAMAAITSVLLIATTFVGSVVVPPRIYAHILGAYNASPSQTRQQDLAAKWDRFHEEMLVLDWLALARQWEICHGLWPQSSCAPAPLSTEAQGIAREILTATAHGS